MTKKQKKRLNKIITGGILFFATSILNEVLSIPNYVVLFLYLIPYLILGYDVLYKAIRGVKNAQILDENFLMGIATIGALVLGEYAEAVFVMLFYKVGELFEDISVGKSRRSIALLAKIKSDEAFIEKNGKLISVSPETLCVGDTIVIRTGDRIPLDAVITEGSTSLDTSALTGESLPCDKTVGDEIVSGCINLSGTIKATVTKTSENSTVSRILALTVESSANKAKYESIVTRFARYYTPFVVILALIIGVVIPLIYSIFTMNFESAYFSSMFSRALIFLVVSCPCALVISVPLSFFAGIGEASRKGILIKGAGFIEQLSMCKTFVFDKTGTLTKGVFKVKEIHSINCDNDSLLEKAALCDAYSTHPIGCSLREEYAKNIDFSRVSDVEEKTGLGVIAKVDGNIIAVGNARLMEKVGADFPSTNTEGTTVFVSQNGIYIGHIVISDEDKSDSKEAIEKLHKTTNARTIMLTGDNEISAMAVAKRLGIDEYKADLFPSDKVTALEKILAESNEKVCYIGDGINDAPSLTRADVGVAMGAFGSDAAIEASDVVLMHDSLLRLCEAVKISKITIRTVKQNIVFAIGVKILVLILGAFGFANMWLASFADVGVSVIAIINAVRRKK